MDVYSLVAGKLGEQSRPVPMSARDEQLYYAQVSLPRLPAGLVGSITTLAGVVLLLLLGGQVA